MLMAQELQKFLENIQKQTDVRNSLIGIKSIVSGPEGRDEYRRLYGEDADAIAKCLVHEDPKVRKNAASILGSLHFPGTMEVLLDAYEAEETLYVRSTYVKALAQFDCSGILSVLSRRLAGLTAHTPAPEEEKHVREETQALLAILQKYKALPAHTFQGYGRPHTVILQTLPAFVPAAERFIREKHHTSGGLIQVRTTHLKDLQKIRPVEEILFMLPCGGGISGDEEAIARALYDAGLSAYIKACLPGKAPWYFRLELKRRTLDREDAAFVRRTAACIERVFQGVLINAPSGYELEIRLLPKKDGAFLPLLKFSGMRDERFAYRQEAAPGDLRPFKAAGLLALARPFMKEDAAVLDAFCAGATALIERQILLAARTACGVDISEEAVRIARQNTAAAGFEKTTQYVLRDFRRFTYPDPFDEIIADMPRRFADRQETDAFYAGFLDKCTELLTAKGIVICHSCEQGLLKKQLRLHKELRLMKEFVISEKKGEYLFILGRK